MKKNRNSNPVALVPILVFLVLYLGTGIIFEYVMKIPMGFYNVPIIVAFMAAILVACMQNSQLKFDEKLDVMAKGLADRNIVTMLLIFITAGIFVGVVGRSSAESVAYFMLSIIPAKFAVAVLFIVACFVSTAMGTSVGTITLITPIAVAVSEASGFSMALCVASVMGGAMFGDNLSFISDTTIAACNGQGCKMTDKFKENFFIALPAAIVAIVKSAFTGSALAGGAAGTMVVAMQKGIARGIFSNEAGLGSAPIAAAAAQTHSTVRQGLVSMTGTFIDTIVICTMTGLTIVITGTWNTGLEGVAITTAAFQKGLPFPPAVASLVLMVCLVFFAFTTILGWNYYGERCIEYLFNRNKKVVKGYRWLYILAIFIGPYMTVEAVWNIADIFNALMAFPNLIALIALSPVVFAETKAFFGKQKAKVKSAEVQAN